MIQFIELGLEYIKDSWNIVDVLRTIVTISWIIFKLLGDPYQILVWILIILNVIRGITGFKAFDKTRFYIKLILQSLNDIKYFLIIFMYTTVCFGVLFTVSIDEDVSFNHLWVVPFYLTAGNSDNMGSDMFNLKYISFCLALVINIVLMLNMIISILGNSFDQFQLMSEIIDYKEMGEFVLEIEQIKALVKPTERFQYLNICINPYKDEKGKWNGKVLDSRIMTMNTQKAIEEKINESGNIFDSLLNQKISAVNDKLFSLDLKINSGQAELKNEIKQLDEKMQNILALLQSK